MGNPLAKLRDRMFRWQLMLCASPEPVEPYRTRPKGVEAGTRSTRDPVFRRGQHWYP